MSVARVVNPINPEIKAALIERIKTRIQPVESGYKFTVDETLNLIELINMAQLDTEEASTLLKPFIIKCVAGYANDDSLKLLEPYMH